MVVELPETNEFRIVETTRDLNTDFDGNEITGNFTKRPLTQEEFCTWKQSNYLKTPVSIPIWLDFYMKFHDKLVKKDLKAEPWMEKLEQTAPITFNTLLKKIETFYILRDEFEDLIKKGKICTNAKSISKFALLIEIEPDLYEAYKTARMFTEDDKTLMGNEFGNKLPISYEEFCTWEIQYCDGKPIGKCPRYNNFILKFLSWLPKTNNAAIEGMKKEMPLRFARLSEIISKYILESDTYKNTPSEERKRLNIKEPDIQEVLVPIQTDLYVAYIVAKRYASDEELFM